MSLLPGRRLEVYSLKRIKQRVSDPESIRHKCVFWGGKRSRCKQEETVHEYWYLWIHIYNTETPSPLSPPWLPEHWQPTCYTSNRTEVPFSKTNHLRRKALTMLPLQISKWYGLARPLMRSRSWQTLAPCSKLPASFLIEKAVNKLHQTCVESMYIYEKAETQNGEKQPIQEENNSKKDRKVSISLEK